MQHINLATLESYDALKFNRSEVVKGERLRTLLLCLAPGQAVPSHRHEGYEVQLQGLRGTGEITLNGERLTLCCGEIILADGASDFAPANRSDDNLAMLITLVRK